MESLKEKVWCDWGHECEEARLLPIGGGGNLILCKAHFIREMFSRGAEKREEWEALKIYNPYE